MKLTEKTLSQEYKYRGKIVNLRVDDAELENGHVTKREVVEHPGGVTIGALTDKNELLFVRQFRYPYQQVILETPAGKRELKEETGATGRDFQFLGNMYPTPGYCREIIRLYACRVDGYGEMDPDDDEFLEVERIPLDKAVQMVMDNEIPDGKTQILILKIAALVRENKI